jgi:hypothetical protein
MTTTYDDDLSARLLTYAEQLTAPGPVVIDEQEDPIGFCRVKWRPSESRLPSLAPGEQSDRCYAASM